MSELHVTIAKVSETLFDGPAKALTVPGTEGVFEILKDHEAVVSTLKPGTVVVRTTTDTEESFDICEGGVVEVSNNQATVLL